MDTWKDPDATNTSAAIEPGDTVTVEGGRFRGCVLTYVGPAASLTGYGKLKHVCINRTYGDANGHIIVPGVTLFRKGNPAYAK